MSSGPCRGRTWYNPRREHHSLRSRVPARRRRVRRARITLRDRNLHRRGSGRRRSRRQCDLPGRGKLCGRAIAHKTERGLVRLRIADNDALAAACDELLSKAVPEDGEVEVLVSAMVTATAN